MSSDNDQSLKLSKSSSSSAEVAHCLKKRGKGNRSPRPSFNGAGGDGPPQPESDDDLIEREVNVNAIDALSGVDLSQTLEDVLQEEDNIMSRVELMEDLDDIQDKLDRVKKLVRTYEPAKIALLDRRGKTSWLSVRYCYKDRFSRQLSGLYCRLRGVTDKKVLKYGAALIACYQEAKPIHALMRGYDHLLAKCADIQKEHEEDLARQKEHVQELAKVQVDDVNRKRLAKQTLRDIRSLKKLKCDMRDTEEDEELINDLDEALQNAVEPERLAGAQDALRNIRETLSAHSSRPNSNFSSRRPSARSSRRGSRASSRAPSEIIDFSKINGSLNGKNKSAAAIAAAAAADAEEPTGEDLNKSAEADDREGLGDRRYPDDEEWLPSASDSDDSDSEVEVEEEDDDGDAKMTDPYETDNPSDPKNKKHKNKKRKNKKRKNKKSVSGDQTPRV